MRPLGAKTWVIPEGYIPASSHGPAPAMESHETACILNTGDRDAAVSITVFFADHEPVGPFRLTVGGRRTRHVRFNELRDPEPIGKGVDFASVIESDQPVIVQHTRLDTRQAENALLSTMAYPAS